jgi:hypothetical protein
MRTGRLWLLTPLLLVHTALPLAAQSTTSAEASTRRVVVDSLAGSLVRWYVFPDVANRLAADLRARLGRGEYDSLTGDAFARRLTSDMRAIAHDGHLRVRWTDGSDGGPHGDAGGDPAERQEWLKRINYGFEKVEILPGNVGLLEIGGFLETGTVRQAALEAMRRLAGVDALIIDLRKNGGGQPGTVALVSSFLFPKGQRVHLNDLAWREGDRVEQFHTIPDLDVPRVTGPVYVLTSRRTFSAAEEFTYNLKQLKRATQVGETTGGGANPGRGFPLHPDFGVFIPTGRAVNPITHDNWEGKGCVPEVPTSAEDALETAHRMALAALGRTAS